MRLVAGAVAGVLLLAACAAKPPATVAPPAAPPPPPPADVIVLLSEPDGSVGAADVTTPLGTVALERERAATRVTTGEAPSAPAELSETEVSQLFGDALGVMPPSPKRFTLYFRFESEELTAESRADIPRVLQAVKQHPAPEVLVVGHTDTTGAADRNVQLGMRRAITVRDLLIASDLDRSTIEVASYGETDLLIKTADDVFEPRNRRVDITVR
jgi:outer membrane protein OmpA-like peptidoglycan-associated protein